ncbi:MAG: hypothetical protein JSS42_09125, partial [Proteobacteria bacterium]|nr:hypothetical protein [Pseudomonadota bacterium]
MQHSIAAREGARGGYSFSSTHIGRALQRSRALLLATLGFAVLAPTAQAQVSLTAVDTAYTQNFNSLSQTCTSPSYCAWTDNTTPLTGWYATYSGGSGSFPGNYRADNGSSNTGAVFSYGATGSGNRALGAVTSGTPGTVYLAWRLVNNTGVAITSLKIDYTAELWRYGGSTAAQKLAFDYQIAAAGTITAANTPSSGWTTVSGSPLDFSAPTSGTAGALDGTAAANQAAKTATIPLSIAAGQEIWLRWSIARPASGSSSGFAVEDLSITANPTGGTSTPPTATGSATPQVVAPGDTTTLTIKVTPGTNPASVSYPTVAANLSSIIPGATNQAFSFSGTDGTGNQLYTYSAAVDPGTATGAVSLPITVVDDQSRTAAPASISLSVQNITPLSIMDIQGHGARSSYAGSGSTLGTTYVTTPSTGRQNIVTAVGPKGFFVQDTVGDGDLTTSDGIYVYLGVAPSVAVGDLVTVTGRVQEFSGSTEIAGGPSYTVVGHDDNSIPAPYDLTANLPSTDPGTGICTGTGSTIQVPSLDGLTRNDGYQAANFACLDGMLVTMSHGMVNAPTYTAANSGTTPSPATPNNGFFAVAGSTRSFRKPGILGSDTNRTASIPTFWGNPELIQVYYPGLGVAAGSFPASPNMPTGGIYNGGQEISLTGIIQGFQSASMPDPTYELYPRSGSDLVLLGAPTYPASVSDPIPGKLTIGTQNMLHFFNNTADGADTSQYNDTCANPTTSTDDTCPTAGQYATRLKKMSLQIRGVLKAPVVQVVQEAENYSVLSGIANQIHGDDATITYHPYLIPGNDPGGINIGILVRDGVTVNSVTQIYGTSTTTACSSGGTCLLNDRPPVLLDAVYQGYHFRVLAIYDRSLSNLGATGKDYVGRKRREQAEQVASIVQALQTNGGSVSGNAQQASDGTITPARDPSDLLYKGDFPISGDATVPVIILGDFNAYEFTDGYVDVTGTIMGTVDTDPTHSVYPPTASYVAPNPALFDTGST